jgi:hypothetical protein
VAKGKLGWIVALLLVASAPAHAQSRTDWAEAAVRRSYAALDGGDAAEAARLARGLIESRGFAQLPGSNQYAAAMALARALAIAPGCAEAVPRARERAAANGAGGFEASMLLAQVYACDDFAGATPILADMIRRHPRAAAAITDAVIFNVGARLRDSESLRFLTDGRWDHDAWLDMSPLRLELVRAYLAEGRQSDALQAARDLAANSRTDAGSLVVLLVDKTFDAVVAADPAAFAFETMMARQLDNAFADAAAAPDRLELVNALAEGLIVRNRGEEALLVIDDALARVRASRRDAPAFTDLDEALNWTHDARSRVLEMLGRNDEALKAMAEGADQAESGRTNVSQTFNYAAMLVGEGRPAEAIALLENFDLQRASPYGRSVVRRIRVCAYAMLEDRAAMAAALADIQAHAEDSLVQLRHAALCAGAYDLAASAVIRQFELPFDRRAALLALQTFRGERQGFTGWEAELYGRPDVRAVVERSAHIRTFPIFRPF